MTMVSDIRLAKACISSYKYCTIEDKATDTQALMIDDGDVVILAFRGTQSFRDIISDLMVYPVKLDMPLYPVKSKKLNRRVHHGVFKAVASIYPEILNKAIELRALGKPLYITGHSFGGGLATLCAAWLQSDGIQPAGLTTFGALRIWFLGAGGILEGIPGNRYTRPLDPITGVPYFLYRHDREETELPGDGLQHFMSDYLDAVERL